MNYALEIGNLLARYHDLTESFFMFEGDLQLTKKYSETEWMSCFKSFVSDSYDFFDRIEKQDNDFAIYLANRSIESLHKEETKIINTHINSGGFFTSRIKPEEKVNIKSNKEDLIEEKDKPMRYDKELKELSNIKEILYWLQKKYGSIDIEKIEILKSRGEYGDWIFELDRNAKPTSVSYLSRKINLSGLRLMFFYLVMEHCFYSKNDIAIEELSKKMHHNTFDIRKFCSEVNKKLKLITNLDHFITSVDRNKKPNHYKLEQF